MPAVKPIVIPGIFGGLNSGSPRELISPIESPSITNFIVKDGVLQKRTGYTDNSGAISTSSATPSATITGTGSASPTTTGTPSATTTGTPSATTTGTPSASSGQSDSITQSATQSITQSATQSITQSATSSLSTTSSATQSITATASATGSVSGSVGATLAKFFHGHHYQDGVSGDKRFWLFGEDVLYKDGIDDMWHSGAGTNDFLTNSAEDYYFTTTEIVELDDYKNYMIVNQSDTKRIGGTFRKVCYSSSPTSPLVILAGGDGYNGTGTDHYCKRVISYGDHLHLLHTKEHLGGEWLDMFQRHRWSNLAHFTATADWNDVATAGAGYKDLKTDFGSIMNGEVLVDTLYDYLEGAIYACYRTGSSTDPFHFEPMLAGLGLYSPRLLASNGESHFFVGSDHNIYQYYGGRNKVPIGDKIKTEFFDNINNTQSSGYARADRSWAFVLRDIEAVIFAIPTGSGNTDPTLFYVYFWRDGRWDKWDYIDTICGMGNYERPSAMSVNDLPIFSDSNGCIYQYDYSSTDDDGIAIDATVETKDFVIDLKNEYRDMNVWFEASGDGASSSVDVSVSVDSGNTFSTAVTKTITSTWDLYKANFNVSGYVMRFKFRNNTVGKKLLLGRIRSELVKSNEKG